MNADRFQLGHWSRECSGFTLIDLLVTVSLISILASLALPSYHIYILRGCITDAATNLSTRRVQLEQFFQDSRTYVGAPACDADSTTSKYFTFSCTAQAATAYTLQAVGKGLASGFTFTIDQNNVKATTSVPSGWTINTPNNCWVIRKSTNPC